MKITKRTHSARPPRAAVQQKALENLKKFQAENRRTPNRSRERSELLPAAVKTGEITPTTAENALGRQGEFNKYRDIIGSEDAFTAPRLHLRQSQRRRGWFSNPSSKPTGNPNRTPTVPSAGRWTR